jgi:hypothetical protein
MKASVFYRIASVLLVLFAVGHTLGFCQSDPSWGVDGLLSSMRSIHFDAQGFSRTYWDFFSAFGLFFSVFLLFAAGISVAAGATSGRDFGRRAQHCLGARRVLCCSHSFELEIHVYYANRVLNGDYSVFDCGDLAVGESKLTRHSHEAPGCPSRSKLPLRLISRLTC